MPRHMQSFNSKDIGDIEIMGMYTGFFKDMSTGVIFGIKLPTGTFTAPGLDRDTQIGSGSTDLLLGAFHRGMLTGDNAWQYFTQVMWRRPFLYQSAADPQGFFDGNPGVVQTYYPGEQIDGAVGILYNNLYHVLGFDKITPLAQVIVSHRDADSGTGSDPYNSGFDRVMLSPGLSSPRWSTRPTTGSSSSMPTSRSRSITAPTRPTTPGPTANSSPPT